MDRRNFLRSMLGVAAATALPSEVFPFRKIFLPSAPKVHWMGFDWGMESSTVYYCSPEQFAAYKDLWVTGRGISYLQKHVPMNDFIGLARQEYPGRLSV